MPEIIRWEELEISPGTTERLLASVHGKKAGRVTIHSDHPLTVHMDGELLPEPVEEIEIAMRASAFQVVV